MNYENQSVTSKEITYQVRFSGDSEHFEKCHEMLDDWFRLSINFITQAMWQNDHNFKAMYCVKDKPIVQRGKTHADVELPNLNGVVK